MKAMILAAGLGTRLKPWTLEHPKALVPVDGVPMLARVMKKLKKEGFDDITVNVHHFSDQIIDFIDANDFGVVVKVSDETKELLDTGGGILQASKFFGDEPVLVHNVDILSNTDLGALMETHNSAGNDITLLTSDRDSSRKLIFDKDGKLCGWHNLNSGEYKPGNYIHNEGNAEEAFSGIYVIGPRAVKAMKHYTEEIGEKQFPIMDFFLSFPPELKTGRVKITNPIILDIGKPDALARASDILKSMK